MVIYLGSTGQTGRVRREVESKVGYLVEMEYGAQKKAWMDDHLSFSGLKRFGGLQLLSLIVPTFYWIVVLHTQQQQ
jgi:hypothetical protein